MKKLAIVFLGLATGLCILGKVTEHKQPPPEYRIACDGNGHFCSMEEREDGSWFINDAVIWPSRQIAIDVMWDWHDDDIRRSKEMAVEPHYDFHECAMTNEN